MLPAISSRRRSGLRLDAYGAILAPPSGNRNADSCSQKKKAPIMQIRNADPPIQVTGRHVSVTDAMKEYCRRRLACLHLDYPKIIEVQMLLDVEKYRHTAEVILHCSNHITLEASAQSDDMYASIDQVVDKIARQMRKYKTRLMRRHRPRRHGIRHLEEKVLRWEWTEEIEEITPADLSSIPPEEETVVQDQSGQSTRTTRRQTVNLSCRNLARHPRGERGIVWSAEPLAKPVSAGRAAVWFQFGLIR